MKYSYTFAFTSSIFVSLGMRIGSFSLFKSGSLFQNTVAGNLKLAGKTTGSFGMIWGCNVMEIDRTENGIVIRTNRKIVYVSVDGRKDFVENPPTDADLDEAAMAAREDWSAVVDKEDWTMVVA